MWVRVLQSDELVYHNKHRFRLLRGQFRFGFVFFNLREHEGTVSDEFVYHNKLGTGSDCCLRNSNKLFGN